MRGRTLTRFKDVERKKGDGKYNTDKVYNNNRFWGHRLNYQVTRKSHIGIYRSRLNDNKKQYEDKVVWAWCWWWSGALKYAM